MIAGLRYTRRDPVVGPSSLSMFFVGLAGLNFPMIMPMMAKYTFHRSGTIEYGIIPRVAGWRRALLGHSGDQARESQVTVDGHGHGPLLPVSVAVRRLLVAVTVPLVIANVVALAVLWPRSVVCSSTLSSPAGTPRPIAATVTNFDLGGVWIL